MLRVAGLGLVEGVARVVSGGCNADQMNGDEQLLHGRVYGTDHDAPNPGPLPHRTYAELVGGPLDGLLLDIHGWRTEDIDGWPCPPNSDSSPAAGRYTTRALASRAHRARA